MSAWLDDAAAALAVLHSLPVEVGMPSAPSQPGLYALHAAPAVWEELRLGEPPDQRPLYVGKSESSLAGRDVATHFGYTRDNRVTSVTGSSTVRRSLSALLHDSRGFRGVPRNPGKQGHYSNYGLTPIQDSELSEWMRVRLRLACWPLPPQCEDVLLSIEQGVFRWLQPPLNLKEVVTPWKPQIDKARSVMRDEARARAAKL